MGQFILPPKQQMVQGFPVNKYYTKKEVDALLAGAGGGITSLNGLTGTIQTFTAGTGISILSTGSTHLISNEGVTSFASPSGTLTTTGATLGIDVEVNQSFAFTWTNLHNFNAGLDFLPADATTTFLNMQPDSGTSSSSRLKFISKTGGYVSLESSDNLGKDVRLIFPDTEPTVGAGLRVASFASPDAQLEWATTAGDVVGPASALNNEMAVFDGTTGKIIKGATSVLTPDFITVGANSVLIPYQDKLLMGLTSSNYQGTFVGNQGNLISGVDIWNSNTGTSAATQYIVRSASTTGGDVWGSITAYGSSYITSSLQSRFVIEAGTSQQMVFKVDSNFEWRQGSTAIAKLTTTGLYIGNGSPTAVLHLKAGTATANTAPIKFTSGTLLTTPEAGVAEFLSEKFYLTPTSTARQSVPGVLFTQTSTTTVANTVTETALTGTGVGSLTLPANFFVAGKTLRFRMWGIHSATASPTIRIRVKFGSTTILDTTAFTTYNGTNEEFLATGDITCRTTGASGTVIGQGEYKEFQNPPVDVPMVNTTTTTVDTTASQAFSVTAEWGTAAAGNTISSTNFTLEVIN